jgi:hypothetical protein
MHVENASTVLREGGVTKEIHSIPTFGHPEVYVCSAFSCVSSLLSNGLGNWTLDLVPTLGLLIESSISWGKTVSPYIIGNGGV